MDTFKKLAESDTPIAPKTAWRIPSSPKASDPLQGLDNDARKIAEMLAKISKDGFRDIAFALSKIFLGEAKLDHQPVSDVTLEWADDTDMLLNTSEAPAPGSSGSPQSGVYSFRDAGIRIRKCENKMKSLRKLVEDLNKAQKNRHKKLANKLQILGDLTGAKKDPKWEAARFNKLKKKQEKSHDWV